MDNNFVMSSLVNPTIGTAGPVVVPSQPLSSALVSAADSPTQRIIKKSHESESESESDSFSDDDDSSDDSCVANNPVLKERLKQLDRYATPINHANHSPMPNPDHIPISNLFTSNHPFGEGVNHNNGFSVHVKSNVPSEVAETCSTASEYRSHQHSFAESPNGCSGPASLNAPVTPKHNFSPSYSLLVGGSNSGPSSQQDQLANGHPYQNLSNKFCKANNLYGARENEHRQSRLESYTCESGHEFTCEVCQGVYANRSSLQTHMKKHLNYVVKRHQCDHCPYSTQYGKNLFKHVESMHTSIKTTHFRCETCCRSFHNDASLREHECLVNQNSTYRCEECGRVFKTKLRLKYHSDIHNPRKPYVCDVEGCDRAFRTPKYLKNHRDEFHRMQPKNYLCPVEGCDLIFHRKTHLKRHIATHDESEKKYHCQWPNCQRRFCSEETLSLHYRKHTGEKPFNCALCPFSCYNKPSLNEHYRLQHAKDSNTEGPYKNFEENLTSSPVPHHLPVVSNNFNSHLESDTLHGRTSTPGPPIRHRMADILESCGAQQPGPLDAEINGILDSLDKESDLPDLFSSGTFDFEQSNPDPTSFRSPTQVKDHSQQNDRPLLSSPVSFHDRTEYSAAVSSSERGGNGDDTLTNVLTSVLSDLQRADSIGSSEEFEKAKANALCSLPTFSTGERLGQQIDEIVDEILASVHNRPDHPILLVFRSARPLTREESYMVDSLEHQLISDSPLTAPTPPRRRGRRPKLQQQLQPYLERIFSLESGTAEAMAAHLVSVSQRERGLPLYDGFCNDLGYVRTRGRGRGNRIRGRSGRPLSLTLRILPDGTATRAQQVISSVCRTSTARGTMNTGRRSRGGIRGRYRIDRAFHEGFHMQSMTSEEDTNLSGAHTTNFSRTPNAHVKDPHGFNHDCLSSPILFSANGSAVDDVAVDASVQLRAAHNSDESDEELDELEELDEEEEVQNDEYDSMELKRSISAKRESVNNNVLAVSTRENRENDTELLKAHCVYQNDQQTSGNQDTLGEMLEDLGVIVKRIGERAAATSVRKQPFASVSPSYRHPAKLLDYSDEEPQTVNSVFLPSTNTSRSRSETLTPSVQLPSMATLASASVGTPASTGGSTPGCLSNAEALAQSPRLSSLPSSQYPASSSAPHESTHSYTPPSDRNSVSAENHVSGPGNLSSHHMNEYKSSSGDFSRVAPMWSCESMCCTTTRDNRPATAIHDRAYSSAYTSENASCSLTNHLIKKGNTPSYNATDLSTRLSGYSRNSGESSSSSPKPFIGSHKDVTLPVSSKSGLVPVQLSSSAAAMGSLMSAVEAVDHLRSLSALGAKYTASLSVNEDDRQDAHFQHNFPTYQYSHGDRSPPSSNRVNSTSPVDGSQHHTQDIFAPPNMPSSLNSLLCRDRKTDNLLSPPLNLPNPMAHCGSPSKPEFQAPAIHGQVGGAYSPYHLDARGRGDHCGDANSTYPFPSTVPTCSPASSSSSSARSYLQDLYHQREQYQQQQPSLGSKSPAYDLTTRQLLSEAAATAYAHGLGRCEGQNFMTCLPVPPHANHSNSPRANAYAHSGGPFSGNHYNRYHQHSESNLYPHPSEHGFPANEFGNSSYTSQTDPYSLYQQQLRQTHSLSRSSMEHAPSQTASHLAQSIHEVSGLGVAEAAAAAAYAYHQYHQQQQQQQAHRHNLSAHTNNYPNLFNTRGYGPSPLDEHFTPRDLALYTAHPERRDPKSTYLAENYRGSQPAAGRFLF